MRAFLVASCAIALGCSAASGDGISRNNSTGSGGDGAGGVGGGSLFPGGAAQGGGNFIPSPTGGAGADDPNAPCSAVEQRAEQTQGGRADVIIVVDSSGSMGEENAAVQTNLNRFSTFIINAGIDVHVVLLAGSGDFSAVLDQFLGIFGAGGGDPIICIDPPLGAAGACPGGDDTNLPTYMHWREAVGSHDALSKIQSTYGGWSAMLRPDAFKTFVVVTDDEAEPPDAAGFTNWVNSQPAFQGGPWRFSGIFCETDGANCANPGTTYSTLAAQTQGVVGDLAQFGSGNVDAEFQAVFDQLADLVVAQAKPVDCEWGIPAPPEGETFDQNAVNVRFTSGDGQAVTLYALDGEAECDPELGGWFYDDNATPTRVVACPTSCSVMQADLYGKVEVLFGCARERPPLR